MKNKKYTKALALASLSIALSATNVNAAQLAISSINFTNVGGLGLPETENLNTNNNRAVANLINGSGITTNGDGLQFSNPSNPNNVTSNLIQQTGGLLIDLGSVQDISALQIFAFNDQTGNSDFTPASFDLLVATDATAVSGSNGALNVADISLFTQLADDEALFIPGSDTPGGIDGGTDDFVGETFTFGNELSAADQATIGDQLNSPSSLSANTVSARFLFLDDLTGTTRFGGRVGFSEIQVFSATPVPEPSSTALLGLGGLALILRRRK